MDLYCLSGVSRKSIAKFIAACEIAEEGTKALADDEVVSALPQRHRQVVGYFWRHSRLVQLGAGVSEAGEALDHSVGQPENRGHGS